MRELVACGPSSSEIEVLYFLIFFNFFSFKIKTRIENYKEIQSFFSGFEAGGKNTPSIFDPWVQIGNDSNIILSTDRTSTFEMNEVALKMEVLCDNNDNSNPCPSQGVGVYNPGFWGMVCYFICFLAKHQTIKYIMQMEVYNATFQNQ